MQKESSIGFYESAIALFFFNKKIVKSLSLFLQSFFCQILRGLYIKQKGG